ncbi:MAG: flavin reductase (DIM6/NTAB) family NADH-FMN oxidoreductase RutF [Marivirga sp.]|jgi:flavin reductase (DIM6/NTAB) family NADH-FMN oxidoreductase RutF
MKFNEAIFEKMASRYRANFFNNLNGCKSANLIGTENSEGLQNLAIFNSVIHLGANPPLMGFILRPTTVDRHTYTNIITNKYYTINHVNEQIIEAAHHTAANYPADESEFLASGLSPEYLGSIKAPFVKESFIKIGLEYRNEYLIEENGTRLIIGQVKHVELQEDFIKEDGSIDLVKAKTVSIAGLDTYLAISELQKLPYAKPKN